MPLEDYTMIGKIGQGKYSSVYKIKRKSDSLLFALKKVQLNKLQERAKQNAFSQQKMLKNLNHPNIISLIQSQHDQQIQCLYLIIELSQHGDLQMKINECCRANTRIQQEQIWNIILNISKGLSYLHSKNIMHRDIKPSNILIFASKCYKIADLNVSKISNYMNYTRTGTLSYVCPEIWKGESYDIKSDIWSFGCMIYELMCLKRPFFSEDLNQMYKKVTKCHFININDNYSQDLKNLVSSMMQLNPKIRPSAQYIYKTAYTHFEKYQIPILIKRSDNFTPFNNSKQKISSKFYYQKSQKTCSLFKKTRTQLNQPEKNNIFNRRNFRLKTRLQTLQKLKQQNQPTIKTQDHDYLSSMPSQLELIKTIQSKVMKNRVVKMNNGFRK